MNNSNSLISIIIPVYNSDLYIKEAIESILIQKYKPIEIIVVDDGSTDSSAKVIKQFSEVKYIYQENSGPAKARNKGLLIAEGEFVTFIDADDIYINNSLWEQLTYLKGNPAVDIVEGRIQRMFKHNKTDRFITKATPFYHCSLSCSLYRKSVFKTVGVLEGKLTYGEDADWFMRAWENNIVKHRIDLTVLLYRRHGKNMTNNITAKNQGKTLLFKLKLERQKTIINRKHTVGILRDYLGDINVITTATITKHMA